MSANEIDDLDAADIGTPERMERTAKRVGEANVVEITQFAKQLKEGRRRGVFFYAASKFDWEPIHRFTHLCDTFIYVDPRATKGAFKVMQRKLEGRTRAGSGLVTVTKNLLSPEAAYDEVIFQLGQNLAEMRIDEWTGIPNLQNRPDRPAWGTVHKLKRTVGGVSRDIWLIFVSGSPLVAYERLFIKTGLTPEYLAIGTPSYRAAAHLEYNNEIRNKWIQFAAWDGEFGRFLRRKKAAVPKLVIVSDVLGWPTVSIYYYSTRWLNSRRTFVRTTSNDQWQNPAPVTKRGKRRVIITRRPLTPQSAASFGAVVLSPARFRQYQRHRWPQDLFVILSEPPEFHDEHPIPDGPRLVNLDLRGIPLLQALERVEAECIRHGITSVAIQGLLGFEDEATALATWRQQKGKIKKLILHVECDGHLLDYGQVADEID